MVGRLLLGAAHHLFRLYYMIHLRLLYKKLRTQRNAFIFTFLVNILSIVFSHRLRLKTSSILVYLRIKLNSVAPLRKFV